MRYVIFGAGAIGGVVGANLALSGRDVAFVARGPHLDALRTDGLTLRTPDGDHRVRAEAVGSVSDLQLRSDDVVLLTMKSQDTESAVRTLADVAHPDTTLVCMQNGVANEAVALRRFRRVVGACVVLPATHLEPGVVIAHSWPIAGVLELGWYPSGTGGALTAIVDDLGESRFDARARHEVMAWKYTKLLANLGNALIAAMGTYGRDSSLFRRARAEAIACYEAAGITWVGEEEEVQRRGSLSAIRPVDGDGFLGGSTWQSLRRHTGAVEVDWLNGEIALLGRLYGIPTPVNEVLQRLANRMAATNMAPGSVSIEEIEQLLLRAE